MNGSDRPPRRKQYYSVRTGRNEGAVSFGLDDLRRMLADTFRLFEEKGYFQHAFGYHCVDAGDVQGELGSDISLRMQLALRKADLWPITDRASEYSEEDAFDVIEFLYDHVSKPVDGYYHQFSNCGWHYDTFDGPPGQAEFRAAINGFLPDYAEGYELSEQGEILSKGPNGLSPIFGADVPHPDQANVVDRVNAAVRKYRLRGSTADDRRDAVRDLADVLEYLRPRVKEVLTSKDEQDIFTLANKFGIRHHREDQATNYDKDIWYAWVFYYYLATIHACLRLIERHGDS